VVGGAEEIIPHIESKHNLMASEEKYLHIRTANYIRANYPDVPFNTDMSGFRLPIWLARLAKQLRSQRGWPDLNVPEPHRGYAGLYIEIKKNRDEIYTKAGKLRQTQHIQGQAEILQILRERGYKAEFACGDAEIRELIDWYLSG